MANVNWIKRGEFIWGEGDPQDVMNRPLRDVLEKSGLQRDGVDFAGFVTTQQFTQFTNSGSFTSSITYVTNSFFTSSNFFTTSSGTSSLLNIGFTTNLTAVPIVENVDYLVLSNSGSTTVTNFSSSVAPSSSIGRRLTVEFTDSNTMIQSNTNIKLSGSVGITGSTDSTLTLFLRGGTWREIARSFIGFVSNWIAGHPNEPTNMTSSFDWDFNVVSGSGGWNMALRPDGIYRIQTDATAPKSPSNVGEMYYPIGYPRTGTEPAVLYHSIAGSPRYLYTDQAFFISANAETGPSSTWKIDHLWIGGGGAHANANRIYTALVGTTAGSTTDEMEYWVRTQQTPSDNNYTPNLGTQQQRYITRGVWHRIQTLIYLGTPGNADGTVDVWIDGVKTTARTGCSFLWADDTSNFTDFNWAPTFGGTSTGSLAAAQYQRRDYLYGSTKS